VSKASKEADGKCNRIDEVSSPVRTQSKALSILLSLAARVAGMKTTIGQTYWYGSLHLPLIGKPKAPIFLINGPLIRLATINFAKRKALAALLAVYGD